MIAAYYETPMSSFLEHNILIQYDLSQEEEASYDGPNPLQLMEPLFNKLACSYRVSQLG